MSLRNRRALKLPKLNPVTPEDHRQNINTLTIWANDAPLNERVRAYVRRATDQSIANATPTGISFSTTQDLSNGQVLDGNVEQDPYRFWNPNINAQRLICPQGLGGVYLAVASVQWEFNVGTQSALIGISKNSNMIARSYKGSLNSNDQTQTISCMICLSPGNYVELVVFHAAGVARLVEAVTVSSNLDSVSPFLEITRISE